ncbi:MAG: hypothetical protein GYB65_13555 [Chloroflexi bacterium]|nr:hypothetical protein [Chloroflexota bacterium]
MSKHVYALLITMLLAVFVPVFSVVAQDGGDGPALVFCESGSGCAYSPISGELSNDDVSLVLGEEDPYGNDVVVCDVAGGCQWANLDPEDLDLVNGGDGEVNSPEIDFDDEADANEDDEIIFDEDEVEPIEDDEMIFDEDEVEAYDTEALIFDIDEITATTVTPKSGNWTAYHLPGAMVCDVITIDIPASPPQSGTVSVSEDGSTLTLESLDAEVGSVPMVRVAGGYYHGELTIEGITLNYEEFFLDDGYALGLIHATFTQEGVNCQITRRFWTVYDGEDLVEDPGEDLVS